MEIAESIGWIALGILPMFGSMEVAWRLGKRRRSFKPRSKEVITKEVSGDVLPK